MEVMIIEINPQQVISRLKELGATPAFDGKLINIFYDFSDFSLRENKKMIRLRMFPHKNELTFKARKPDQQAKVSEELQVEVSHFETAQKILQELGLHEIGSFEKYRRSFELGKSHIDIDEYPDIPPAMEIEAPDEITMRKTVEALGFKMEQTKAWSGKQLAQHYGKPTQL